MNITITNPPGDGWAQVRAILESVEPGAGSHCIFRYTVHETAYRPQTEIFRHERLGVTVRVELPRITPPPARPTIPMWMTPA